MVGWIKSVWECRGKERMKLIAKGKKKRKKRKFLVYVTDLPVRMRGFWVPVIANVYGHMRITGRRTWVQRGSVQIGRASCRERV